jgi:acetylornithine deacetylase/succinyl-diaminopimelate desuccinylase-like protein
MRNSLLCTAFILACGPALAAAPKLAPGVMPPPKYQQMGRDILATLIDIDSTHAQGSTGTADAIRDLVLKAGFPASDVRVLAPADHPSKGNVVIRLRGSGHGKPVLYIGHIDVVEVDKKAWATDPFKLTEKDGYFFGRGVEDMKGEDAVLLTALIRARQEGFVPDHDIIMAFTADEEAGGDADGVQFLFAKHRDLVESSLVINVDGGGAQILDGKRAYIGMETSEKLYATYEFYTENRGGHSSLPRPDNAIYQMTAALQKLAAFKFPLRTTATTRAMFTAYAGMKSGTERAALLAVAQPKPDVKAAALLSQDPEINALLRTTCVATMIQGGQGESALPNRVHATVQCRIMPGETPEQTLATLTRLVGDPGVKITVDGPIDPSPETPPDPKITSRFKQAADRVWPNSVIMPIMDPGASDSVYARLAGVPSYVVPTIFIEDSRAHARDERIPVQTYDEAGQFAYEMVKEFAK